MNFSLLQNLQLNKEQKTLSSTQQKQLLEVVGGLLHANYDPRHGSLLIVRAWADGTFEEILSGDLMAGGARGCHTQRIKQDSDNSGEKKVVNDVCRDSATYVGHEVSEALQCDDPGSFYYGKLYADAGSIYARHGHYLLSLPCEDGRIVTSFRASYFRQGELRYKDCKCRGPIASSVDEAWQHELMLASLAKALSEIMSDDLELKDSFLDVLLKTMDGSNCLTGYDENERLILKYLNQKKVPVYIKFNISNSKLPCPRQRYAMAIRMLSLA